jgi:hypothetical protein
MFQEGGAFHQMKDWGGKYMGNLLRIAGVIHLLKNPTTFMNMEIDADTVSRALKVGPFLIAHAQSAYGLISEDHDHIMAKRVLTWIRENKFKTFTQGDCHRRFKNTLTTASQVAKILKLLEERHYIRPLNEPVSYVGRPPRIFETNPMM